MPLTDTQKRRNKDNDTHKPLLEQSEDSKSKSKMAGPYLGKLKLKNIIIFVVIVVVFLKLWHLFSTPVPSALPPPEAKVEIPKWQYSNNPQGVNENSLNKLLEEIRTGSGLEFERPLEQHEVDSIKILREKQLPKVEKFYKSTGSLTFKDGKFILDNKPLRILSGAMHYFRVMPEYWSDRMKKMKACGLNTLETYVSWNLHEESPGVFNFNGILDIRRYIEAAQREGLYVILRPGPYICSEWDFGGMPAWLLKDPKMKVRSNYPGYQNAVSRFFGKLIPLIADLQHSKGGPIIAVQIENEFGSYSNEVQHLKYVKELLIKHGIKELLLTSDGIIGKQTGFHVAPFYDESLPTANFMKYGLGEVMFDQLRSLNPDFPLMVMEFWAGWFDHWTGRHAYTNTKYFAWDLDHILRAGASVNFYMFHGGTNFGFMSGANWFNTSSYKTDTTSYDYIAPLSEAGDITPKFEVIRELIKKHVLEPEGIQSLPEPPPDSWKGDYGSVKIESYMQLEDMIVSAKRIQYKDPMPMEMLDINNGVGQNHGFTLYRAIVNKGEKLKFTSPVPDRAQVILNGIQVGLFNWFSKFWDLVIPSHRVFDQQNILDILVENHGRVNYVQQGFNKFNEERKGIQSDVLLDGNPIHNWEIYPLEFKPSDVEKFMSSNKWQIFANWKGAAALYTGTLDINGTPKDTFLNMQGWVKGIAIINGFNLGRYWNEGPQKTLYVPAPILKTGKNKIVIFELHQASHSVSFNNIPTLQ